MTAPALSARNPGSSPPCTIPNSAVSRRARDASPRAAHAVVRVLACALLLIGGAVLRRRAGAGWLLQLVAVAGLVLAAAWTSHAAARVGPRALLLALDALHQLAAGVWIGGLAQLLVLAWGRSAPPWPAPLLKRFSATALAAVAVLVAAGGGLALAYVDGPRALLGTSYGLMVGSKAAILLRSRYERSGNDRGGAARRRFPGAV